MSTKFRAGMLALSVSAALGTAPAYAFEDASAEEVSEGWIQFWAFFLDENMLLWWEDQLNWRYRRHEGWNGLPEEEARDSLPVGPLIVVSVEPEVDSWGDKSAKDGLSYSRLC